MRIALLVILIVAAMASCNSAQQVTDSEINDPELVYITDYESRLSQAKMRKLKSRYNRSAFGISLLNASASPAYRFDPAFAESHKELPNYFRKIKIINESPAIVYIDLDAQDSLARNFQLSVKSIVLPKNEFVNLLTAREADYTMNYSWNKNMTDSIVVVFKPSDNKIIHIRK